MLKLILLAFVFFLNGISHGQNAFSDLKLQHNKKNKVIKKERSIDVRLIHSTSKDSIFYTHYGTFKGVINNKLLLNSNGFMIETKKYGEWKLKYVDLNSDSTVEIPLESIHEINEERSKLVNTMFTLTFVSLTSAMIVSPIISVNIWEPSFNTNRFLLTSGISLATAVPFFSIAAIFYEKNYLIHQSGIQKRKVWKIISEKSVLK